MRSLLPLLSLVGCASFESPSLGGGGRMLAPPRLEVEVDDDATVTRVSWDTDVPSVGTLWYGEAIVDGGSGALDRSIAATSADGLHHEVTLAGLAAGVTWSLQAVVVAADDEVRSEVVDVEAPALPSDLPAFAIDAPLADSLTGFSATVILQLPDAYVAVLDGQGRYVWWRLVEDVSTYRAHFDAATGTFAWLTTGTSGSDLWTCTLDGEPQRVASLPRSHHDFIEAPGGGWYVLVYEPRDVSLATADDEDEDEDEDEGSESERTDPGATQTVYGDQVVYVSADGSDVHTVWSSWDEFPFAGDAVVGADGPEYPHANSLELRPDTGELLISMFAPNTVALVDPSTGRANARIGGEDSDWTFTDGAAFAHQHAPKLLDGEARLAIFDNGEASVSEAAIYALDWTARTATRTWHFDDDGAHTGVTMGSVDTVGTADDSLIAWGSDATLTRVSAAGEVQLEVAWEGDSFGYSQLLTEFAGATR